MVDPPRNATRIGKCRSFIRRVAHYTHTRQRVKHSVACIQSDKVLRLMEKSGAAAVQISARETYEHSDRRFGSCDRAIAVNPSQLWSNEPGRDRNGSNNFYAAGEGGDSR